MKHYVLFYSYVADYLERRAALREAHLRHAWEAQKRGTLILGGVLSDPVDTGLLFFEVQSPQIVEAFVHADPYVLNGLVESWRIREWLTVVGDSARTPIHPRSE
jgi:hypothetical protein